MSEGQDDRILLLAQQSQGHQDSPDQRVQASQQIERDHPMSGDPPDRPIVRAGLGAWSNGPPTLSFPLKGPLLIGGHPTGPSSSDPAHGKEKVMKEVWQLLAAILANKLAYKILLDARDDKAQAMLDILHKVLYSWDVPAKLGRAALYAIMRLCTASGVYPRCLALQDIRYEAKPVASGAFGDIWKGHYRDHPVCLKVARVYQVSDVEHLTKTYMREAIMWSHLSHPNVLPFYGIYQVDERLGSACLVSPWMPNGNVNEYLRTHTEIPRLPLVRDILAGLEYLHKQSVVHGDLKGANILISNTGSAYLADFGLSSIIDTEILRWTSLKTMTRVGGTVRWQAPEVIDDPEDSSQPTLPADVYSVASVMYEVFTGQLPYHEIRNEVTVVLRVMKGHKPTKPSPGQALELSTEIWEVINRCWNDAPAERPSIGEVVEALSKVIPTEVTLKRVHMQQSEQRQAAESDVPSASSFRAAMRDQSANFTVDEVDLLREYTKDLLQVTLDASISLLPPIVDEVDADGPQPQPQPNSISGGPNEGTQDSQRPAPVINPLLSGENGNFKHPVSPVQPQLQDVLPIHQIEPGRLQIHYLLAYSSTVDLPIQLDVSIPWSQIQDQVPNHQLSEPATHPPISTMAIISRLLPWELTIVSHIPGFHVTVADVLHGLFRCLRPSVTRDEYETTPEAVRVAINLAYHARCAGVTDLYARAKEESKGVKRVDFLQGRNVFKGLSGTLAGRNVFKLNVALDWIVDRT